MTATDQSDVFSVYTVSWEVFDGARWKTVTCVATPNKDRAEQTAEQVRSNPQARTRNVEIAEKLVREVRTSVLPYWVPAGDAA